MSESVILSLGIMLLSDPSYAMELQNLQLLTPVIWKNIFLTLAQSYTTDFYSRCILTYCRELSLHYRQRTWNHDNKEFKIENRESKTYVHLEREENSKLCVIDIENWLEVRNDSWTFETLLATHGTPILTSATGETCFAYELEPCTDGLIQVGWASKDAQFDPEGGMGVGDDDHSYAFDGRRAQKWHGRWSDERSSYGQEWNAGDVITCLLDLGSGKMSYYRNGEDMGVAFEHVPCHKSWYPAISVSTSQGCKVYFGSNHDPLRYAPPSYKGMASLTSSSVSLVLPPPHIKIPAPINADGDVSRRASSCSNLSGVSSSIDVATEDEAISIENAEETTNRSSDATVTLELPSIENDGNVEPNLVPIDKVPPWEETKSNFSNSSYPMSCEPELEICSDSWDHIIPSLYFEVELGFRRTSDLDLTDDTKWMIRVGLTDLSMRTVVFDYDVVEKCGKFVFQSADCHFSPSVYCNISDGDVVGFMYDSDVAVIGFTVNGIPQYYAQVPNSLLLCTLRPYVPHLEGTCRAKFNYGQSRFQYSIANQSESTNKITSYLDSLVNAPYK